MGVVRVGERTLTRNSPLAKVQSMHAPGDLAIQVSRDIGDFMDIWPTMSELRVASNVRSYAFQCRDHLQVWLETIGAAGGFNPFFVAVRNKTGAPMLLLPLGVSRHRGLRVFGFLDGGVCDYNAPVVFEAAASLGPAEIRGLWDSILGAAPRFDVAALEKCPEFVGDFRNPLHVLAPRRWPASGHYLILGPCTADGALEKERDLKDSHRKRRRIAEIGELKFGIACEGAEIDRVFAAFIRQKSRRYMETLGTPGFDVAGQRDYYLALTRQLSGSAAQLSYLSMGDEIIATAWSLISGRRFYYLMCAYEAAEWGKYSPGRLLMEDLIRWAYAHEVEVFDLGIGDEAYKLKWRQNELPLGGATYPRTLSGHLYCAGLRARNMAKESLPPFLVRALKAVKARQPLPTAALKP